MAAYALNALLPGSALLTRERFAVALPLLVAGLACLSLAALTAVAPVPGLEGMAVRAIAGYAALGALATVALGLHERSGRIDPALVRALHRETAVAYLRSDLPAAYEAARKLVRAAPRESGAWDLLALIARARGDAAAATKAVRRARALDSNVA